MGNSVCLRHTFTSKAASDLFQDFPHSCERFSGLPFYIRTTAFASILIRVRPSPRPGSGSLHKENIQIRICINANSWYFIAYYVFNVSCFTIYSACFIGSVGTYDIIKVSILWKYVTYCSVEKIVTKVLEQNFKRNHLNSFFQLFSTLLFTLSKLHRFRNFLCKYLHLQTWAVHTSTKSYFENPRIHRIDFIFNNFHVTV